MSRWFNILVYLSLIFLLVALYTADYLVIPKIYNVSYLLVSTGFLFLGFLAYVACWDKMLRISGIRLGFNTHLAGNGLSIFGKYIPGKVWVLLGRSVYINEHHNIGLGEGSLISFKTQLISIWIGLLIGLAGFLIATGFSPEALSGFALWLILSPLLFSKTLTGWSSWLVDLVLKKKLNFPRLKSAMF